MATITYNTERSYPLMYDRNTKTFCIEASSLPTGNKIPWVINIKMAVNGHTKEFRLSNKAIDNEGEILSYCYMATDFSGFKLEVLND